MQWTSRYSFLLATIGISVGLGNIWRFPYVTGVNGGGAFIVVYLLALVIFAMPILIAELMIGRKSQSNMVDGWSRLVGESGRGKIFRHAGWFFVIAPIVALSYYSVVAGWLIDYSLKAGIGLFNGQTTQEIEQIFSHLMSSPLRMLAFHTLFLAILVWVLCKDINEGLGRFNRIAMPMLAILLITLAVYSSVSGNFFKTLEFLFYPDFSKLNGEIVIQAVGQAFFSLGVAAGGVMIYGSYLGKKENIPRSAIIIASADTLVALIAGFIIFPLVFHANIELTAGPGLIFIALPTAVSNSALATILLTSFFVLVAIAAATTSLSMLEPAIRWLTEKRGFSRKKAAVVSAGIVWFLGIASVLSFNLLSHFSPLGFLNDFQDKTIFDVLDYFIANIFMPFNGLLIVIMIGWIMQKSIVEEEYGNSLKLYKAWRLLIRYIAPIGICALFLL